MKIFVSLMLVFVLCVSVLAGEAVIREFKEVPFVEGQGIPAAEPGYIWCLITKPAVFETVKESVKTKDASFYMEQVPAQYEVKEETVVVSPAYRKAVLPSINWAKEKSVIAPSDAFEYRVIPAVYADVEEDVVVTPAYTIYQEKPAVFEDRVVEYLAEPSRTNQAKIDCNIAKVVRDNEIKGQCYTQVDIPASTQSYTVKTLVSDATVEKVEIPAVTKKIKVRKMVEEPRVEKVPATTRMTTIVKAIPTVGEVQYVDVPAVTKTIRKLVEVAPATTRRVEIPAEMAVVTKEVMKSPAQVVWRRIPSDLCNGAKSRERVIKMVDDYGSVPGYPSKSKK